MSTKMIPIEQGADLNAIVSNSAQYLRSQGYEVMSRNMGGKSATMTISKNYNGLKKLLGLGVNCNVTITKMGSDNLSLNIVDSWGNKIVALAIGLILGMAIVPIIFLITGIMGCMNQSKLSSDISTAFMASM